MWVFLYEHQGGLSVGEISDVSTFPMSWLSSRTGHIPREDSFGVLPGGWRSSFQCPGLGTEKDHVITWRHHMSPKQICIHSFIPLLIVLLSRPQCTDILPCRPSILFHSKDKPSLCQLRKEQFLYSSFTPAYSLLDRFAKATLSSKKASPTTAASPTPTFFFLRF